MAQVSAFLNELPGNTETTGPQTLLWVMMFYTIVTGQTPKLGVSPGGHTGVWLHIGKNSRVSQ